MDSFDTEIPPEDFPDKLNFRPLVLRTWFLATFLGFNLFIVGLLVAITITQHITLLDEWAYFVIQILPLIIGTITSAGLEAIILALSRITPFIRCVQPGGDTAGNTILKTFYPLVGMRDALKTKNYLLCVSHILLFGGGVILALKASLLTASYPDVSANVTEWTLGALFGIYVAIIAYIAFVMVFVNGRKTGLRNNWDIITIADHLTLFRHSNLLRLFEGSSVATRESMDEVLGDVRLKLAYWKRRDDKVWYGFRVTNTNQGVHAYSISLCLTFLAI